MATKLILINTDTHAVVPREPTVEMLQAAWGNVANLGDLAVQYRSMTAKAPPLTTPPVLRWEWIDDGYVLLCGNAELAHTTSLIQESGRTVFSTGKARGISDTPKEARRAAEKALGIPFEVEEV